MSISPVSSITKAATYKDGEPLNILTFPTHERYETSLAKTGHNFYAYRAEGIKDWNTNYGDIPENYNLLNSSLGPRQIPLYLDFDIVLSQNKFGQYQIARQIADTLHVPLVSLEHTLPVPSWPDDVLLSLREMRGNINLFISEYSLGRWGWEDRNDTSVIHHGVNTELFKPDDKIEERENHILSVVNDWINRDWCCGFTIWQNVIKNFPFHVVGDTPGLSEPAGSIEELAAFYAGSRIFLNTSTISPVPTSLLEAMACGCAIVSTSTCMIPEIIQNGVNGFISNDEDELREYLVTLLNDEDLAKDMGAKARQTVIEKFSEDAFINNWKQFLDVASQSCFKG